MAVFKPGVGVTSDGVLTSTGTSYIGDTSNAKVTLGLTINQGAADDEIQSWKSSDVGHGMTTLTEDDTYGSLKKHAAADGGARLDGYSEVTVAVNIVGNYTTSNTTKSVAGDAAIVLTAAKKTGTTAGAPAANDNIVAFQISGTGSRFIFDSDGDSHQDVGTAWTNF